MIVLPSVLEIGWCLVPLDRIRDARESSTRSATVGYHDVHRISRISFDDTAVLQRGLIEWHLLMRFSQCRLASSQQSPPHLAAGVTQQYVTSPALPAHRSLNR